VARKRLKRKKHSCKVCKPGKTSQSNRWRPKDDVALRRFEKAVNRREWELL
jgi:hypothetical protein